MNEHTGRGMHPSRLELEGWLCGEPGMGPEGVGAHLEACPACAARMAEMRAQGDRFRFRNPDFAALSARRRRIPWAQRLRLRLAVPGKPAAAFGALALAAAGTALWTSLPGIRQDTGAKGAPAFLLFDSHRNRLDPRDTVKVRDGDTLQLALTSEAPIHYRIFSRAEDGALSELMPRPGEPDSLGAAPKGVALPHSLVYSAPVRPERIICVWSRRPLDWNAARALLAGGRNAPYAGADSFQVGGIP